MEKLKVKFPFATPRTRQSEREKAKDGTRETKQSTNKDPTGTIRQRRYVKKWKNTEKMKKQNQAKCKKYQEKLKLERKKNPTLDWALKKKERERKALYRHKKEMKNKSSKANIAASNANDPTEVQTREAKSKKEVDKLKRKLKTTQQRNRRNAKKSTIQSPEAIRKRASRVKKTLPTSPVKWAHTVSHIVRNASPRKKVALQGLKKKNCNSKKSTTRVSRSKLKREIWKKKVETFLLRDDISRQMPNKKDVLKVNGNLVAKRHLLLGKKEAYMKFREENSDYPFRYTSFRRSIPKQIKKMKLSNRRVCVCLKCFNMTEMVSCLNEVKQKGTAPFNIRSLYKDSVCQATGKFPDLACIEGKCALCKNRFKKTHQALVNANRDKMIKYCQWEQVNRKVKNSKGQTVEKKIWQQVVYREELSKIFEKICSKVQDIVGHVFRNDYQFFQHKTMAENLPQDQAIVYADFSQNYALVANDEIQASHYVKSQVTLHTMYLVRHDKSSTPEKPQLTREAIAIISDDLKHNTTAVYNFTLKLLSYMRNNPQKVEIPRVLHRITDNCGFEYKCSQAFSHLNIYEEIMGVKIVYHYSEPGHGKGPHDGIGATIKHGLDMLVVQDRVHLRNAYEAYIAANNHLSVVARDAYQSQQKQYEFSKRTIMYVPAKSYQSAPKLDTRPVKGTLTLRFIQSVSKDKVEISNLSCSCPSCMFETHGECEFQKWKKTSTQQITKPSDKDHVPRGNERQPSPNSNSSTATKRPATGDATDSSTETKRHKRSRRSNPSPAHETNTSNTTNHRPASVEGDCTTGVVESSIDDYNQHMLESAQCMSRFSESVTRKGYKVVDTPMDGNCAFWAISNQTENCNHDELREKAVEYIQNLPQSEKCKMGEFLTESIHDYLFHMSQDGSYADHPILTAISNLLCVTIKIVHESTRDVVITPDAGSPTSPVIYLGYLPEMQHYVGLQPFNRFDPEDFVGVKLVKRSKAYMFLAKVVDIGGDDVKLRFMKATSDPNVYTWPDKTDVSCQPIEDVVLKLSQPTLTKGRGIKLRFNSNELNVCQQKM